MGLGRECATVEFVDGMEGLDRAIRSLSAMLNRFNIADVYIGVDGGGEPTGGIREDDVDIVVRRIGELLNRLPEMDVIFERTADGRGYIRISASGYETPYAYGSWFYTRKCNPKAVGPDGSRADEWTETITCGMKRH